MDKDYWNNYYKKNISPKEPSDFAKEIVNQLDCNKNLLEIGCGNGRDSIFFSKHNLNIFSIDQSEIAIEELKKQNYKNITFIKDNFVDSDIFNTNTFDYVYSRFTLHSISENEQNKLLDNIYKALNNGGMLFIEARSINDTIYGYGTEVEKNAFIYNDHYRRFINIEELTSLLQEKGFEIVFAKESNNWAIYKNENPVVIRIYAKKQ